MKRRGGQTVFISGKEKLLRSEVCLPILYKQRSSLFKVSNRNRFLTPTKWVQLTKTEKQKMLLFTSATFIKWDLKEISGRKSE